MKPADAFSWISVLALVAALLASIAAWGWIAARFRCRRSLLPYTPRRPVPWQGLETLMLLGLYFAGMFAVQPILSHIVGISPHFDEHAAAETLHPIARLLQDRPGLGSVLLCFASVVVVAPLVEEFFFRVVLQGWLEAEERRWRRQFPLLRRGIRGLAPVGIVALLFAAMHSRTGGRPLDVAYLRGMIAVSGVMHLASLTLAVLLLRIGCRASWSDLGFCRRELRADALRGLVTFAAVAAPAYLVQIVAGQLLPDTISADPAGLTLFALAMGVLYFRTHRIVPSMALHMALNASSFLLLVLGTV
jgi:membrane protease YdiL (CAAX protease family)